MSLGEDGLLRIVQALHEGASDPAAWSAALDVLSEAFGGAAVLLGTTPDGLGSFALAGHRMAQESVALINGALANRIDNPIFRTVPRAPLHRPILLSERLSTPELTASAVYRRAMTPTGIRYVMTTVVDVIERGLASFSLGRSARGRDFDAAEIRLAARLGPHVGTALRTRRRLNSAVTTQVDAMSSLDVLDRGVILTSVDGHVRLANREAERIFMQGDGLLCSGGRLSAVRSDDTVGLLSLIAATCRGGTGGALSVRRIGVSPSYAVQAAPSASHAIIFVSDPMRQAAISIELLIGLYGLSPAEAALTGQLLCGRTLRHSALTLLISENTAKTQLKAVFDKVGVDRQPQLVQRISENLVRPSSPPDD